MISENWICETHTSGYEVRWKITGVLHRERTAYQELMVVETVELGKALILDGALQIADKDEFIYHEMISHVPVHSHPHPERILVIGGGDGGTVRELTRYPNVKQIDLVEIDKCVIQASQRFFPAVACGFEDSRVNVYIQDGLEFVQEQHGPYDIIIVDSSDPVGPAVQLFSYDFYANLDQRLAEDGMMVIQSESPIFYEQQFRNAYHNIARVFPITRVYLASIPTYVGGPWSFTIGSKKHQPDLLCSDRIQPPGLKYYNREVHKASFVLPGFVARMLEQDGSTVSGDSL